MPDDMDVYGCLESPLYGGLLHVLETMGRAVKADTAAARLFGVQDAVHDTCVLTSRLQLPAKRDTALADWPRHDGCVFEVLAAARPPAGVWRPRDHLSEQAYAADGLYRQIEATHPVIDCACQAVELGGEVWCLFCYVRCTPSLPFREPEFTLLRRFQPNSQRIVQTALRREMRPAASSSSSPAAPHEVPLSMLLARLSRTECQVLSYLRTALTEREIAERLERSYHTVHVHVKNIYRKFGVTSRKQLMQMFIDK